MQRRQFCRTALAVSVAAAIPMLPGCEKKAPVATEADTSIRGISLDGAEIELEKAAIKELGESMTGTSTAFWASWNMTALARSGTACMIDGRR